ncbi:hypothetical protein, partial [Sphingobacterium sp. UBA7253]|uniref:hypothetical protein n=1 Tax=Sphingobacterium sp. UBA7253 TaxID=1947517 RepID=UPI00257DB161
NIPKGGELRSTRTDQNSADLSQFAWDYHAFSSFPVLLYKEQANRIFQERLFISKTKRAMFTLPFTFYAQLLVHYIL